MHVILGEAGLISTRSARLERPARRWSALPGSERQHGDGRAGDHIHGLLTQELPLSERSAIEVLINRVSSGLLTAPGPTAGDLQIIQQAALRAADHRQLRPWRFLVIEGQGLERLGELFLTAKTHDNPSISAEEASRTRSLPLRAPLLIVAIASCTEDPKVPEIEQLLSAGAAVQNMLNAAFALGYGAMWRTGDLASHAGVRDGLGLGGNETIVGFLYLGTSRGALREAPGLDTANFFKAWP